jgi:hypothetical protein
MSEPITERDFRKPEFRDAKPEDYERRDDGAIVRKDRWEKACYRIASLIGASARDGFECDLLVFSVEHLIEQARKAGIEPHYFEELPK